VDFVLVQKQGTAREEGHATSKMGVEEKKEKKAGAKG